MIPSCMPPRGYEYPNETPRTGKCVVVWNGKTYSL